MKLTLLTFTLILFLAVCGQAGQVSDRYRDTHAAVVISVKGTCLVRDDETSESRRLKKAERVWPGQQLQCAARSSVKIKFRISEVEREFSTSSPNWYLIPNPVVSFPKHTGLRLAGRAKGNEQPQAGFTNSETFSSLEISRNVVTSAIGRQEDSDFDVADLFWRSRQKYFLIVAASETRGADNSLGFTKIDAEKVQKELTAVGYQKLDILDGRNATKEKFVSALKRIQSLPPNATVIVYYSGHAFTDVSKSDLLLQLYGQEQFGDEHGLAVSGIVTLARGQSYKGELAIILDTCYSGQAVLTSKLSLRDAAGTAILASSSDYQTSYSVRLPDGVEMSVFTYFFLQGLSRDWEKADTDHDGVLFYADLKRYINEQLLRTPAIPRMMEPQLFDNPNAWVAFDARKARNSQTPTIGALISVRLRELQDPEVTMSGLSNSNSASVDSYLQALLAIQTDRLDDAERLLAKAESERRVSIATVFWARAIVRRRMNDAGGARVWFEKALAAATFRNIDLMLATALANGQVANWLRQRELLNAILEPPNNEDNNETIIGSLFLSAFFYIIEGNPAEAERHVKRLKAVKQESLTNAFTSAASDFVQVMSEILSNDRAKAKRKLDEIRASLPIRETDDRENIKTLCDNLEKVLDLAEPATAQTEITPEQLRTWETLLNNRSASGLVSFLRKLLDTPWDRRTMFDSIESAEVGELLNDTVALANQLQIKRVSTNNKVVVDHQLLIAKGGLLTAAGDLYWARSDNSRAEKLYLEVIELSSRETGTVEITLSAIVKLADLYVDFKRYVEAENLYKDNVAQFRASFGEKNLAVFGLYKKLGEVYERANRFEDAEKTYRLLVDLTETEPSNIFGIASKEALAKALVVTGKYEEAIKLLDQVIPNLEQQEKHGQQWAKDSLAEDYFIRGKSNYFLERYDEAQKWFRKSYDIGSNSTSIDLSDQSTTLVWQWATSMKLKKPSEAVQFYVELLQLVRTNLEQSQPDGQLGAALQDLGETFSDWNEFEKAEEVLRLANALEKKRYGEDSRENANSLSALGKLYFTRGGYRAAINSYAAAKDIYDKKSLTHVVQVSYMWYMIGYANYRRLDLTQARSTLKEAVRLLAQMPESSYGDNYSRELLAKVETMLGHLEEAEKIAKSLVEEAEKSQPLDSNGALSAYLDLSAIARLRGNLDEANNMLGHALKITNKMDSANLAYWPELDYEQGMIALMHGRTAEAARFLQMAVDNTEKNREDQPFLIQCLDSYAAVLKKLQRSKEAAVVEARSRQIRQALAEEREPVPQPR